MDSRIIRPVIYALFFTLVTSCGSGSGSTGHGRRGAAYYQEKFRPGYHFSPESGWMNDPNGLVYYDGEYHLFYQYYPDSTVWGPMHWGHAVSTDLVHWTHLPTALYPDSLGYIFSGSAVVDRNNTSGFGTSDNPPLVAIFTIHDPVAEKSGSTTFQNQGIAFSVDKGRTWTKYSGNPVLKNPGIKDFRDPKVAWNEIAGKWIMILAAHDRIKLYSSPNLKDWTFESDFGENAGAHGGVWECPDLFPMRVRGSDETKWIMLVSINPGGPNGGSATQYFTGTFDGHKFVADSAGEKWVDWGTDDYAGVTWSGLPDKDDKRIFLGWMSNWQYATMVPSEGWRSSMTLPRNLALLNENGNYILTSRPVKELQTLRIASSKSGGFQLPLASQEQELFDDNFDMGRSELELNFGFPDSIPDTLKIILRNEKHEEFIIGYSSAGKDFFIDRTRSGMTQFSAVFGRIETAPYIPGKSMKLHIFLDAASSELFVDDGKLVMTTLFFPSEDYNNLKIFSKGEGVLECSVRFYELESIWPPVKQIY